MKRILYTLIGILILTSCQQIDTPEQVGGECVLELDIARADKPLVSSRAVDADLAITILNANGERYQYYPAGSIPNKIILEPGVFIVCAHTENQSTWHTANGGKGEACYFASQRIELEYDHRTRLSMSVPMINYAVSVKLPDLFESLFTSYQFLLKSGGREISIKNGEKAYFNVADGGFTYVLNVTNTDGASHTHSPYLFTDIQNGKMYLLRYVYETDENAGGIEIEITNDMETDDTIVDL